MQSLNLDKAPEYWRTAISRGLDRGGRVVRDGGENEAGMIRGVSILTRGEAEGHEFWVDATMLKQAETAVNSAPEGVKSRFGHPTLSGDGLGTHLGRMHNAHKSGDQVFADLHFIRAAHTAPGGNLAGHIMDLAEDDPAAFGTSISFLHDAKEEEQHANNGKRDDLNTNGFPHARIAELRAIDAVGDPAANPNGLFGRGLSAVKDADALMSYVLGVDSESPATSSLGIDPERARIYVRRWLSQNKMFVGRATQEPVASTAQTDFAMVNDEATTKRRAIAAELLQGLEDQKGDE